MRYQIDTPILAHRQLSEFEFELTLHGPAIAREARPGQFVQIQYDQTYNPFNRRPFSIYRVDRDKGTFSIIYLARGTFTNGLRNKAVGHELSMIGPLGNAFTPADGAGVRHIMVAGGVGAPPLYFLASELTCGDGKACDVAVVNGARTRNLLVALDEFSALGIDLHVTTDDGSHGVQGIVTDVLKSLLAESDAPAQVYCCGPTPMLRAVADVCVPANVPCQLSVETMMPCGLGVCMGCVVKIRDAEAPEGFVYKRSCHDGPVFRADEIIWA